MVAISANRASATPAGTVLLVPAPAVPSMVTMSPPNTPTNNTASHIETIARPAHGALDANHSGRLGEPAGSVAADMTDLLDLLVDPTASRSPPRSPSVLGHTRRQGYYGSPSRLATRAARPAQSALRTSQKKGAYTMRLRKQRPAAPPPEQATKPPWQEFVDPLERP